jgi:hypothetical protein
VAARFVAGDEEEAAEDQQAESSGAEGEEVEAAQRLSPCIRQAIAKTESCRAIAPRK